MVDAKVFLAKWVTSGLFFGMPAISPDLLEIGIEFNVGRDRQTFPFFYTRWILFIFLK